MSRDHSHWNTKRENYGARRMKSNDRLHAEARSVRGTFTPWNQQREGLAFVAALEQSIETIDSPSQALRGYVQWTRRHIEHADPIQRFFDALQKDEFGQVLSLRTTMVSVRAVFARSSYGRPRISEDVRKLLGTRSSSVVLSCRRWRHHLHTVGVSGSSPLAPTNPQTLHAATLDA